MSEKKIFYRLKQDLIGCPKGRIFQKRFVNDEYFHCMTDQEVIGRKFNGSYIFQKEEVENNPEWFEPFGLYPEHDKLDQFTQEQRQAIAELDEFIESKELLAVVEYDHDNNIGHLTLGEVFQQMMGINPNKLEQERIKIINGHIDKQKDEE
jgi:hypothetical protein